jgi:hypothetical protein
MKNTILYFHKSKNLFINRYSNIVIKLRTEDTVELFIMYNTVDEH